LILIGGLRHLSFFGQPSDVVISALPPLSIFAATFWHCCARILGRVSCVVTSRSQTWDLLLDSFVLIVCFPRSVKVTHVRSLPPVPLQVSRGQPWRACSGRVVPSSFQKASSQVVLRLTLLRSLHFHGSGCLSLLLRRFVI